MKMPATRSIYSVNEGNSQYWDEWCNAYFHSECEAVDTAAAHRDHQLR
jgi:fructose-1,6-bisphosphatase